MNRNTKKKNKIVFRKIKCPIYPYVLYVRFGGTQEEATKWINNFLDGHVEKSSYIREHASTYVKNSELSHAMWFSQHIPNTCVVAHEALHSVKHVMNLVGMPVLTDENEEAYAYLLQWTVDSINKMTKR